MAHSSPFVYSKFKLSATIGGIYFPDIVSISATFALNSIPEATLVVACGRNARTGKPATIHDAKAQLKARAEAVVQLEVITTDGQKDKMPSGKYTIFRGYYAGLGYHRSFNEANYTIHLIHWLDDLNNSSMLNGNWFPGAPYDLAQTAVAYALNLTEGDAGVQQDANGALPVPTIDINGDQLNIGNISSDLWGKVIKPIFQKVASWPAPRYQDSGAGKNDAALKALDRMPPGAVGDANAAKYTPLALDIAGLTSSNIENSIRQSLTKDACESFAYTTFWSKLTGDYASQFFFVVSPSVDWAMPIPFFGGLREPYKKILTDEYGYANFNASLQQIIESVDVFYSQVSDSGLSQGPPENGTAPSFAEPLGYYPATVDQNKKGMKLVKEAPGWMTNIVPWSAYPIRTTGVGGRQPGDTASPQKGENKTPGGWLPPGESVIEQQQSEALNRFAEHWYKSEVLAQRYGELSGKLRFDIAPGSTVEIETPARDKAHEEGPTDSMFASVIKVSFHINGEKATAGTSFVLAHLRTAEENKEETLTKSGRPPLYSQAWKGGDLAVRK